MVAPVVEGIDLFKIAGRSQQNMTKTVETVVSTPNTEQRWVMCETVWEIVGGERT